MTAPRMPGIHMINDGRSATPLADSVVFVGGPLDGVRRIINEPTETISADTSVYRRSVHCADDGAIRYVFDDEVDPSGRAGGK